MSEKTIFEKNIIIDNNLQYAALFDRATIGIVVTDNQGKIINFNRYAETQFGYTKMEMIGKTVDMLVPTKMYPQHHKHREGFYKHPEPRRMGRGQGSFCAKEGWR